MDQHLTLRTRHLGTAIACVLAYLFGLPSAMTAQAQDLERPETVATRDRPEFDAKGLPLGGFTLFPSVGVAARYDDNIFADDEIETGDRSTVVSPELELRSNWSRHRLSVVGGADSARYRDNFSEEYDDYRIRTDGRYDLRDSQIEGAAWHYRLHEDRTSVDDARGSELTEYSVDAITGAYTYMPGRIMLKGDAGFRALDYDDTDTNTGKVNNDDRDRDKTELGLRAGYKVNPDYIVFAEVRFDQIDYDQKFDNDGFERSSDAFEFVGGTQLDLSGKTFGEVYAGYLERDYDDNRFDKADGLTFGGAITWNVTQLTTLEFSGGRTVDSTTIVGASGIDVTNFGVSGDHELLRNLILSADLEYTNEDFEGIDREDDIWLLEIGGEYKMNRYLRVNLGYRLRDRDTSPDSAGGRTYTAQDVFLSLTGSL